MRRALAQRNALLGRVRAGSAGRDSLAGLGPGAGRPRNRADAPPGGGDRPARRPLLGAGRASSDCRSRRRSRYRPRSNGLEQTRLEAGAAASGSTADLERGFTTHGPHRDDSRSAGRRARSAQVGSQGQQRLALLWRCCCRSETRSASHAASCRCCCSTTSSASSTRTAVAACSASRLEQGQTLITTADPGALPLELGDVTCGSGPVQARDRCADTRAAPRDSPRCCRRLRARMAPPTVLADGSDPVGRGGRRQVAGAGTPVSERAGVVTVRCRSAVWASELSLMLAATLRSGSTRPRPAGPRRSRP